MASHYFPPFPETDGSWGVEENPLTREVFHKLIKRVLSCSSLNHKEGLGALLRA